MSESEDGEKPQVEVLDDEGDADPTEEEVREYADFLGIDPDKERYHMQYKYPDVFTAYFPVPRPRDPYHHVWPAILSNLRQELLKWLTERFYDTRGYT